MIAVLMLALLGGYALIYSGLYEIQTQQKVSTVDVLLGRVKKTAETPTSSITGGIIPTKAPGHTIHRGPRG